MKKLFSLLLVLMMLCALLLTACDGGNTGTDGGGSENKLPVGEDPAKNDISWEIN